MLWFVISVDILFFLILIEIIVVLSFFVLGCFLRYGKFVLIDFFIVVCFCKLK